MKVSKLFYLNLAVAAMVAVPSDAFAQGGRSRRVVVSYDRFGPVKIGMTLPQAARALGVSVTRDAGYDGDGCYYASPKEGGFKSVAFMMSGRRIVRVDVDNGDYATNRGARVGDSEARIKRLYRSRYKVIPHKYLDDGHYLEVEAENGRYYIIFETDGKRVTRYRVGIPEYVGYVEGCS